MCGIDFFLFRFDFWKKNSDSVRTEFGFVRFEKNADRLAYYSYVLLIAEWLIYS